MNKLFTKVCGVVLGATLALGVGLGIAGGLTKEAIPAYAEDEVFYTLTPASGSNNGYAGNCDVVIDGITWNVTGNSQFQPWRIGGKSLSDVDRTVYSKTAMGSAITKVELTVGAASSITVNSLKLIVGDDDFSPAVDTVTETFAASSTIVFNPTSGTSWATGQYYKFVFNVSVSGTSNKFVEFTNAKFYREKSASSTYAVTYNANGATSGSVPTDSHSYSSSDNTVTVLGNTGSLAKTGYTFNGWNASNDGTGTHYSVGSTFTISANTTLYAEWTINQYTLTYNANGGTGTLPEGDTYDYGTKVEVGSGSGLSNGDLVFAGWNTAQDGSGENYNEGSKITIEGNTTLYAKWSEPAATLTRVENESDLSIGDEIAIVSNGTGSKKALSTTQNSNNRGSVGVTVHWTFAVDGGYLYAASSSSNHLKTQATNDANGEWTISISSGVASITAQGTNTRNQLKNNGDLFSCYASGQTDVSIYKVAEEEKEVVNSRLTAGTVSAKTGDTEWTLAGFTFEVLYDGDTEYTDVTDKTTFNVTESIPTITEDSIASVTVTPTFKNVEYIAKATTVTATLTYVYLYSIQQIYSLPANSSVEVDGVYMGLVAGSGYIFMNGEYGILLYNSSATEGTYTVGNKYTLSGETTTYSGLYELKNTTTVTALSDETRVSKVGTPSTYVVVGGETDPALANRLTSLSGVVTEHTATAAETNDTVTISVNGQSVTMYIKAAANTSDVYTAICDSLSDETSITIEGFTGWYNGFQVQFTRVVEADANYHAADFAKDLLKQTRATCAASDDGNGSALTGIWTTLAGADYWLKIEAAGEENTLINGTPSSSIVVPNTDAEIDEMSDADAIAAALYRYDWCTAKYNLTNFMGRTLTVSFASTKILPSIVGESNTTVSVIVIVSMVSLTAIGGYFFLKRRKETN